MNRRNDALRNALIGKFANQCLHAVVDEVFVKALPFSRKGVTRATIDSFTDYSKAVYESFGGITMLTKSLEKHPDNYLLKTLANMVFSTATEAADEVIELADTDNETNSQIIEKAEMPEEIYDEFADDARTKLDVDKIADIIKQKTITTINEERQAIQEEEELEEEIREATGAEDEDVDMTDNESVAVDSGDGSENTPDEGAEQQPDQSEDAVESYFNLIVPKNLPRHHVSLFSKLVEVSLESILAYGDKTELPFNTLRYVTLNRTFPELKGSKYNNFSVLESDADVLADRLNKAAIETKEVSKKARDASLTCAITMYALFETFNTLNLKAFESNEVREYVDHNTDFNTDLASSREALTNTIIRYANEYEEAIKKSNDAAELKHIQDAIVYLISVVEKTANEELKSRYAGLKTLVDNKLATVTAQEPTPPMSVYDIRHKEETVTNLSRAAKLLNNKPDISEVRVVIDDKDPDEENLDVQFITKNGAKAGGTIVPVKYRKAFGSYTGFVTESIIGSKLSKLGKTITIVNPRTGARTVISR